MESSGLLEVAYFQVDAYFPYLSGRSISKPNFFCIHQATCLLKTGHYRLIRGLLNRFL